MKPFYLYILRCGDGSLYIGHTDDLETRMGQHATGELGGYTARRHPLTLVYTCEFATRLEALERERQIKGWTRAKKEALIGGDWARLRQLAKGPRVRPSTLPGPSTTPRASLDELGMTGPRGFAQGERKEDQPYGLGL